MKITNVTAKVIGVLGTDLMPDQSMDITANAADIPNIKVLVKMGLLTLDKSAEEQKAIEDAAMEKARKKVMEELRAAGKLKEDKEVNADDKEPDENKSDDHEHEVPDDGEGRKKKNVRRTPKSAETATE